MFCLFESGNDPVLFEVGRKKEKTLFNIPMHLTCQDKTVDIVPRHH